MPRRHIAVAVCVFLVALVFANRTFAGDFKAPENGVITDKQFTSYLEVTKDWLATSEAASKAMEGSKSTATALATLGRMDEKFKAALAKHNLSEEEYSWIGGQVWQAWSVAMMSDVYGKDAEKSFAEQKDKTEQELLEAQKKLGELDAAQKSGKRVLTKEERESRVADFKSQAQSAAEEAKSHADEAKQAADEAKEKETAAAEAEKLAKNPPSDASSDDKESYVNGKKEEAQSNKDAAKEAHDREKEAKKQQAEAAAKQAALEKQAAAPDVPVTDDEKAEVKQQNEQAVQATSQQIETLSQAKKFLVEARETNKKQLDEVEKRAPKENIELLKKRHDEFEKTLKLQVDKKK